ncbi:hypothetical protein [Paenibacillus tianmuensis]|nr:hypothetical protein [Paenibacillus tianmuensis]
MKKFILLVTLSLTVCGTMFIVPPDINKPPNRIILYSDVDTGH